mgnify:CR=1 FL=1
MSKLVVHYKYPEESFIEVGQAAFIFPVDHPNCSNTTLAKTTTVLRYDRATGEFETTNTIYKLEKF